MSGKPAEQTKFHTRLLKCPLEIEHSRAWWQNSTTADGIHQAASADAVNRAFEERWFGARSLPRVETLVANFRVRFDAIPDALTLLSQWRAIGVSTRSLICHWHLQFADPLYRGFTGKFLVDRRHDGIATLRRDTVTNWMSQQLSERWTMATKTKFASRLLACAADAGLLKGHRDPRTLQIPSVPDDALSYLMHLLREFKFEGTLLDNPYLRSVGLAGRELENRLRNLPAIQFLRQGDVVDVRWQFRTLADWGTAMIGSNTASASAEVA